jgi:RND superfamily putative drug exporter
MGPVLALGIATSMLSAFTLLPALLSLTGRWAFWPRIPRAGSEEPADRGLWGRVGRFVEKSPPRAIVVGLAVLAALGVGNVVHPRALGFGDTDSFSTPTDSSRGSHVLEAHYPKGLLAQSTVLITGDRTVTNAASGVAAALRADHAVASVDFNPQVGEVSRTGTSTRFDYALKGNPFSPQAIADVPRLRRLVERFARIGRANAIVGGPTAQVADTDKAVANDADVIMPSVLALIFVILVLLLRSVVAPVHLIVSVVGSFLATLGFSLFLFEHVLKAPGVDKEYPTFLFIFVVALGVDYNIFLVHRIREESRAHGTVEGTVRALARTGGVITSAGIILAGTFLILGLLPVYTVQHIGIGVAIGVLLDTFVVRSFVVPALMMMLGEANWWPRHPGRRRNGDGGNGVAGDGHTTAQLEAVSAGPAPTA